MSRMIGIQRFFFKTNKPIKKDNPIDFNKHIEINKLIKINKPSPFVQGSCYSNSTQVNNWQLNAKEIVLFLSLAKIGTGGN